MALRDIVKKAVEENDGNLALAVVDHLRHEGFSFKAIAAHAKLFGIDEADWQKLLFKGVEEGIFFDRIKKGEKK